MTTSYSPRRSIGLHIATGLAIIALLVLGVGSWAAATPLSGAVVAMGSVVVNSNTKPVQHASGGIVAQIHVTNGDLVEAGTVLIRLDDTETQASLTIIENQLSELSARAARLAAEREESDFIEFPDELLDHPNDLVSVESMAIEERLLDVRRSIRNGQIAQLEERVVQYGNEIAGLRAQIDGKEQELELVESEVIGLRTLLANGHVAQTRVNLLERELANIVSERGVLLSTIARVEGQIAETRLQILQIDSELQTEIARETAEVRAEIRQLTERRIAALEHLRRIDVRAPQDGIVHDLAVHVAGAVVSPGAPLMHIVPVDDDLVVEVRVQPQDIDQLYFGQDATLRFSAFNQRTTPEIGGKISRMGADLTIDPTTGLGSYVVRIETTEDELAQLGALVLLPGMPVEAFIETEQRTALSFLVKPLSDHLSRAFREE